MKYVFFSVIVLLVSACQEPRASRSIATTDYIREIPGESDSIPVRTAQKGEVLIAYSDCYTCHKQDKRSVGPAFTDIAKRYPVQRVYIEMLARKIISGGSGSWGKSVMVAHPDLPVADAETMVNYILSLKQEI